MAALGLIYFVCTLFIGVAAFVWRKFFSSNANNTTTTTTTSSSSTSTLGDELVQKDVSSKVSPRVLETGRKEEEILDETLKSVLEESGIFIETNDVKEEPISVEESSDETLSEVKTDEIQEELEEVSTPQQEEEYQETFTEEKQISIPEELSETCQEEILSQTKDITDMKEEEHLTDITESQQKDITEEEIVEDSTTAVEDNAKESIVVPTIVTEVKEEKSEPSELYITCLIVLQAIIRGYLQRHSMGQVKETLSMITQGLLNSFNIRSELEEEKNSLTTMQSIVRNSNSVRKFMDEKQKVQLIQAFIQSKLEFVKSSEQKDKVIELQSILKSKLLMKNLKSLLESVSTLQSFLHSKIVEENYVSTVSTIQSLQARVRSNYESKQVEEGLKSLEILQSRCLKSIVEKDLRNQLEKITILQSKARTFIIGKKLRNEIENCKLIQSACTAYLKQKQILHLENLSSMIHSFAASKQDRLNYRNNVDNVKTLESVMRGYSQRNSMTNVLHAITDLQSHLIGQNSRKSLHKSIDRANTLLALSKAKCYKKSLMVDKSRLVILQALARSSITNRKLNAKQASEEDLALLVQSLHNGSKLRSEHSEKVRSVNLINSLLSATKSRNTFNKEKLSIQTIQAALNSHKVQHLHSNDMSNIGLIQSVIIAKKANDVKTTATNNIILLQSLIRGRQIQKEKSHNLDHAHVLTAFSKGRLMLHLFESQVATTTKIQSFTRQYTSRKQMMKEIDNVCLLESLCTGFVERRNLSTEISNILQCQSLIRGFMTRKVRVSDDQIDQLEKKTHFVSMIQSSMDGRNIRKIREQAAAHVKLFQAVSRAFLTLDSYQQQQIISLHLQSICRSVMERKALSTDLNNLLGLQALCRSRLITNRSKVDKNRVQIVQSNIRRYLAHKHLDQEKLRVANLQSLIRGFANKQFVKDQIARVTVMQSMTRAYSYRKQMKNSQSRINILQAKIRGYLEKTRIEGQNSLSNNLGSVMKGFAQRVKLFKAITSTIPTIQSSVRQFALRKGISESLGAIINIQSLCRKHLQSESKPLSLNRILSLQALIRTYSKGKHTNQQLGKIPYIQALFRGKQARKTIVKSSDVSPIQAVARSLKQRRVMEQSEQGITKISAALLGYSKRRELFQSMKNITHCQTILKTVLSSNDLRSQTKQSLDLISNLQQKLKTRLELERFEKKKKSSLLLQSLARGCTIRKFIRNSVKPSVELIDSLCIGHIERENHRDKVEKATLLQSISRRAQACNQISEQRQKLLLLQAAFKSWKTRDTFKKELEDKIIHELEDKIKRVVVIQGFVRGYLFRRDNLLYTKRRQESPTQQISELPSTAEILRQLYQNDEFGDNEDSEEEVQLEYPEEADDIPEPVIIEEPHVEVTVNSFLDTPSSPEELPSIIPIPLHRRTSNAPLPAINITASTPTPTTTVTPSVFSKEPVGITSSTKNTRLPSQKPPTRRQLIQNIIEECKRTKNPVLNLSGYDLETLPYSAIDCKHVTELILSQNNLVTLPSWFVDTFSDLKVLDLSGNQLYELPIDLARLSLTSINLSNNKLEFLPQALNEMNTLTKIDISENVLLSLPSTISHLVNVEELDISNNYLMTLPDDIKKLKKLKNFQYYNNEYLQSEISKIAEVISAVSGEKAKTIIQKLRNEDSMGYKEIGLSNKHKENNLFLDPYDLTDMSEATEMYNGEDGESDYSMTDDVVLSPRLMRNNSSATMVETDTTSTPMTPISGRNNDYLDTPPTHTLSVTTEEYGTPCITPPAISDSDSESDVTPPKYNPPVTIPQIKLEVIENLDSPSSSPAEHSPISMHPPKVIMTEEDKKVNFGQLNKEGNEKSLTDVVHMEHPLFATPKIRPVSASYKKVALEESEEERKEREAKENKKSKERINMVLEILESERKYVKYLDVLWDLFYEPIVNNYFPADKNKNPEESERLVPKMIAKNFFPNDLLTIKTFNKNFLVKLEDRFKIYKGDPTKIYDMLIGDLFEKIAPFFKIYTSYLSSYESTMNKIREYRAEDKIFDKWLDKRKTHPRCAGLEIGSFLIMPVQRIPRYKLLLENLCKNTPPDHADYSNLISAIEKITESATTQNAKIKETNNRIKVYQLSRLMKLSDLVQPHRRLIREGEIVFGDQPKIEYKAYLFNDIFVFREKKRQKTKVAKSVKAYSLLDAFISGGGQNRLSMILLNAEKNKTVEKEILFPSHEVKMEWVLEIEKALEEVREKRELISKGTKAIVRTSSRAGRFFRALKSPGRKGDLSPTSSNLSSTTIGQPSTPSTSAPELRGVTRTNSTVSDQSTTSVVSNLSVISSTSNVASSSTSSLSSSSDGKKKSILGKIMMGFATNKKK
ncbi:predicted protein [Naegleria gruberi]|uniref:Predicted protein n=1 Tax=Naegleria gruberi TaxID=5762 RepID=D2VKL1_NAEGR|nr:uncharacterized protein NAEGRDRAFT_80323 [Naegleria gruberi]EFC42614.1 predicted protein [Naegleria gruberi]|eukprot:XP_002675358.1 predicted protein [Naegleria gruberi strain NEG-M]